MRVTIKNEKSDYYGITMDANAADWASNSLSRIVLVRAAQLVLSWWRRLRPMATPF